MEDQLSSDFFKHNFALSSSLFSSFSSPFLKKIKIDNTNKKTLLRKLVFLRIFVLIAFFINLQSDNRKIQNILQKAIRFFVLKGKKRFSLVARLVNVKLSQDF